MNNQLKRGLILEDLPAAQQWLREVLQSAFPGIDVKVVDSVAAALPEAADPPDIALIDLKLPDGNGIDVLQALKKARRTTWCVVTTIYDDDRHLFPALAAGADGYLLKDRSQDDLVAELRRILVNQPPLSPAIARKVLRSFTPKDKQPTVQLTQRQLEVLRMIASGASIQTVADNLHITYHTAASHIRSIYNRLGVTTRAEATAWAIRHGIE